MWTLLSRGLSAGRGVLDMGSGRGEPSWSSIAQLGPEGQQWAAVLQLIWEFFGSTGWGACPETVCLA